MATGSVSKPLASRDINSEPVKAFSHVNQLPGLSLTGQNQSQIEQHLCLNRSFIKFTLSY
ncbi:unnamed protein product [Arabis nemorensis]|uniref:Uncharacterized protein n=1 Tax=Arabis nemorensis TaxID=586526 RepID=A0A565AQA1_9BRAS|nr:unnamed protein product [Arabis nemorensis]